MLRWVLVACPGFLSLKAEQGLLFVVVLRLLLVLATSVAEAQTLECGSAVTMHGLSYTIVDSSREQGSN